MTCLIGRVGEDFKSVKVGRDTFRAFNKLAVHNCTASEDFTDNIFRKIVKENLPLNEKTIKEYISNL